VAAYWVKVGIVVVSGIVLGVGVVSAYWVGVASALAVGVIAFVRVLITLAVTTESKPKLWVLYTFYI
jgi:hypothetical protein